MNPVAAAAIALIIRHEGYRATAYPDPGDGTWTVGWGSTVWPCGKRVGPGDAIDPVAARNLLEGTVESVLEALARALPSVWETLTGPQQAALGSFTYNEGIGNFRKSTLCRRLGAGEPAGPVIAEEFPKWRIAGGKIMPGLVRRRAEEVEMSKWEGL